MEKFITVTVEGEPQIISFNDELHSIKYGDSSDRPTTLEILDSDHRVIQTLVVDENHSEIKHLLQQAKGLTNHFMAVVTPHSSYSFDYSGFTTKMEELGFLPYAIAERGGRVELPQGVFVFDGTLARTSHIKHELLDARQKIQQVIDSSISNPRYQSNSSANHPTLLLVDARNIAWS